ncbi:MAG TPA: DUF6688 family protein [Anaerolineales bacterium]|nr:DUF6688 family protein [Anaerolineales bacterium]
MNIEPVPDQREAQEPSVSLPFPTSAWGRYVYGLFITVLPAFSFAATAFIKPDWQNGELGSYIILLLFPKASLWFLPLLAYSIICYLLLLLAPTRYAQAFVVRAGIYTGVLLALHYSILALIYALDSDAYVIALVWVFPILFSLAYRWATSRWAAAKVNPVLFLIMIGTVVIAAVSSKGTILVLFWIGLTMAGPFWSFLIALRAAGWLYQNYESSLTLQRGLGLIGWLAVYAAAWRYDILKMYELYAQLPPQPPSCYIATAAARGHARFVGARTMQLANGKSMQVNEQLKLLKCAELALLAIYPSLHSSLRKIYDIVGQWLARRIQNPFLADVAYLLLKPGEWAVKLPLKVILPEIDSLAEKMYVQ